MGHEEARRIRVASLLLAALLALLAWRFVRRRADVGRLVAARQLPLRERFAFGGELGFEVVAHRWSSFVREWGEDRPPPDDGGGMCPRL